MRGGVERVPRGDGRFEESGHATSPPERWLRAAFGRGAASRESSGFGSAAGGARPLWRTCVALCRAEVPRTVPSVHERRAAFVNGSRGNLIGWPTDQEDVPSLAGKPGYPRSSGPSRTEGLSPGLCPELDLSGVLNHLVAGPSSAGCRSPPASFRSALLRVGHVLSG